MCSQRATIIDVYLQTEINSTETVSNFVQIKHNCCLGAHSNRLRTVIRYAVSRTISATVYWAKLTGVEQ